MSMDNLLTQQYLTLAAKNKRARDAAEKKKQEKMLLALTAVKGGDLGLKGRNQWMRNKNIPTKILYNQKTGMPLKVNTGMENPDKDFWDMVRKNFYIQDKDFTKIDYSGLKNWGFEKPVFGGKEYIVPGLGEPQYNVPDVLPDLSDVGTEVLPEVTGEGAEGLLDMLDLPEGATETLGEAGGVLGGAMSAYGLGQGLNQLFNLPEDQYMGTGSKDKAMRGGVLSTLGGLAGGASLFPGPHQAVTVPVSLVLNLLGMANRWT